MKRILTVLLVVVAIATQIKGSRAEDYTEYQEVLARFSVDELRLMREIIDEEITRRLNEAGQGDEALHMTAGTVLIDKDGVTITLSGDSTLHRLGYFTVEAIVKNNSPKKLYIELEEGTVNGWTVDAMGYSNVPAGGKQYTDYDFYVSQAHIESVDQIETISFQIKVKDDDSGNVLFETEPITLIP